jgi:hypothetical protein
MLAGLWLRTGAGRPRVWPSAAKETGGIAANDAEGSSRVRAVAGNGEDPARCRFQGDAAASHVGPTYIEKGEGSDLVTAMVKAVWNDLLARFPEPHLLVAVLPDSSEKESIFSAQSAQQLMVRLIRKLSTKADFAVTVSRQSGQREILCAFADGSDARLFASITNASVSDCARYPFLLDGSAERKLLKIAGPPEQFRPRATASDRWQS